MCPKNVYLLDWTMMFEDSGSLLSSISEDVCCAWQVALGKPVNCSVDIPSKGMVYRFVL